MANVAFKKGLLANLPSTITAGTLYVTTDERAIYLDVNDSQRIRLGDFQEFATLEALKANTNPSTSALYYITGANVLAKFNGTDYVQINLDTGATSIEVVGEGNAVTAASYDAVTRKITLTMGETFATSAELTAADEAIRGYVDEKTKGIATDAALGELQDRVAAAEGEIDALQAIDHEAYKAADETNLQAAKDYADGLNTAMNTRVEALEAIDHDHANKAELDLIASGDKAKWDKAVEDLASEIERAKGAEGTNAQAAADALAEAQKKVASVTAGDASVTVGGTATAPTVAAKLSADADNALELTEDGLKVVIPAAAEYSIVKAAESGEYAAVYNLTKDGAVVGASINIPKDLVVKSGSVVGDEIVLVLNDEAGTEIKIPVASLIEYVTSGSAAGDMIVVNVSDDHKVTATITDGSITLAKLATDVQTAIGKAHSHENADVLAGINADKVDAWDAAEQNAKDYADGLNTTMNGRVEALEAIDHDHANKAELDLIQTGDVAKWNAAQANAEATAATALSGAKTELEGKIADAQAAAEKVANDNNSAMDTRVKALEEIDHDAYVAADETNLQAAKDYADGLAGNYDEAGAADQALTDAKAYSDSLVLQWGEF